MLNRDFFTSRGAYVNCAIIAMLYTHSIGNQPLNTMEMFKMRDSVPSASYSSVCNVLRHGASRSSLLTTSVSYIHVAINYNLKNYLLNKC